MLFRSQACARFAGESTRLLQGIGPRTQERLFEMGLRTVGDLQAAGEDALVERFGDRMGRWLKARAFFHDDSPLESTRVAKSRSSETTFDEDVADHAALESTLRQQSNRLAEGLRRAQERGRTIAIKVRLDDWTTVTRARSIDTYIDDEATIIAVALELFREYAPPRPVRLLGVRVAGFEGEVAAAEPAPRGVPPGQLVLPLGV